LLQLFDVLFFLAPKPTQALRSQLKLGEQTLLGGTKASRLILIESIRYLAFQQFASGSMPLQLQISYWPLGNIRHNNFLVLRLVSNLDLANLAQVDLDLFFAAAELGMLRGVA
jgi:hypothetical protein